MRLLHELSPELIRGHGPSVKVPEVVLVLGAVKIYKVYEYKSKNVCVSWL